MRPGKVIEAGVASFSGLIWRLMLATGLVGGLIGLVQEEAKVAIALERKAMKETFYSEQ
jgi:hypothetical protein